MVVDQRALGVFALGVGGAGQPLTDDVVAVGDPARGIGHPFGLVFAVEARAGRAQVLVGGPGERAVVDDHVVRAAHGGDGVDVAGAPGHAAVARPDAEVADDHIVGGDGQPALDDRHPGMRRGLPGDGQERLIDAQFLHAQVDHAAHFEYHDARPLGGDRCLERTGAVGRQRGDAHDLAATPTGRVRCLALGAGECGRAAFGGQGRHGRDGQRQQRGQAAAQRAGPRPRRKTDLKHWLPPRGGSTHRGIGMGFAAVHIVNDTGLPYTGHPSALSLGSATNRSGENPRE